MKILLRSLLFVVMAPLVGAALMAAGDVRAAGLGDGETPVSLQADQLDYDQDSGVYTAVGAVDLQQGALKLNADQVRYASRSGDAEAEGHVHLRDADGWLRGEQMQINMNSGTGRASSATGFFNAYNFHLAGEEIERLAQDHYVIRRGFFTTCDGAVPDWKFGSSRVDVTVGGFAHARHVKFYLRDIPVLYLPYLAYPVKTERESGFLMPMFGYSADRGMQISLAYYQVLADNQDATLYLDHFSDMGLGTGLQYRYIFGRDNVGEANLYYITAYDGSSSDDLSDRFAYRWEHLGTLPGQLRLSADVEYVSDRDYFEDFGTEAEEYDKDEVESTVALSRSWGNLNLTAEVLYTKDLEEDADNDRTLQRLPEIQLDYMRTRIGGSPFYAKFDSTSTYFWRREGMTGTRVDMRPALSAYFQPGDVIEIEPEIGYRERLYWVSGDDADNTEQFDGFEHAENWDLSTRLATRVSRVFRLADTGLTKVLHSVEPEVTHSFVPNTKQSDLPRFDSNDRVENANKLSYALVNRLIGKFEQPDSAPDYRELLYFRLSQEYDIWLSRNDREDREDRDRFSDIRSELILRPTRQWYVDLDCYYNPHENGFSAFSAETGVEFNEERRISWSYRYQEDVSEYMAATVQLDLLKPVYLTYENRYDCVESKRLENVVHLEYRSQCWSLFLSYRDRTDDHEILVGFALSGIGNIFQFGSSLDRT
ncbi:MAG: LPS-assembly protein LptD [Desulfuromonadaceae bacterium]|nr:LPS-assembly protein LptD [Desulfuromonadaceae bacterium]